MRKEITKKFLGKENRYDKKMLSKDVCSFISRKKINRDAKQISYDKTEFSNVFNANFTNLNTNNILRFEIGHKFREFRSKNGKSIEFNMIYCASQDKNEFFYIGMDDKIRKEKIRYKRYEYTQPLFKARISESFWLGEIPITNDIFNKVQNISNQNKIPNAPIRVRGPQDYYFNIIEFCNALSRLFGYEQYYNICYDKVTLNLQANGFRLPTEAEWEYAAKADQNYQYPGSNNPFTIGWFKDFSSLKESNSIDWNTIEVKGKKPNRWGFYDMMGLCYELVEDIWDENNEAYKEQIRNNNVVLVDPLYLGRNQTHKQNEILIKKQIINYRSILKGLNVNDTITDSDCLYKDISFRYVMKEKDGLFLDNGVSFRVARNAY